MCADVGKKNSDTEEMIFLRDAVARKDEMGQARSLRCGRDGNEIWEKGGKKIKVQ
jgi:hypothetical protein